MKCGNDFCCWTAVRFFWKGRFLPPSLSLLCHLPILHLIRSCDFVLSVGSWKLRRCETKECCYESGWSDGCMKVVQSGEFGLNQFERIEGRNLNGNTRHSLELMCIINLLLLIVAAAASVEITSWAPGTHPVNRPPSAADDDYTPLFHPSDYHRAPWNCLKAPKIHVIMMCVSRSHSPEKWKSTYLVWNRKMNHVHPIRLDIQIRFEVASYTACF